MKSYLLKDKVVWVNEEDLKAVLNKKEYKFVSSGSVIPSKDAANLWLMHEKINQKVLKALKSGKLEHHVFEVQKKTAFNVISDDLGLHGLKNHADGKMYDSKSNYYKAVKAAGCEIVGNEPLPTKPREQQGNYDCRADVARAIEQIGKF